MIDHMKVLKGEYTGVIPSASLDGVEPTEEE
jgi:hypothetical protein